MGEQQGHLGQLQLQGGCAAVVAGGHQLGSRHPEKFAHPLEHLLLQGMIGLEVALERPVQAAAGGQEGGMLAGAVVLQRALTPRRGGALQLLGLQIRPPENLEGLTGLNGLAGVGGAGDGQGPVVMAALLAGTAADEHLGLKGLEGRADEAQLLGITGPHQHAAALVADHGVDPMP